MEQLSVHVWTAVAKKEKDRPQHDRGGGVLRLCADRGNDDHVHDHRQPGTGDLHVKACPARPGCICRLRCAEHRKGLSGGARRRAVHRGEDRTVHHGSDREGSDSQHGAV